MFEFASTIAAAEGYALTADTFPLAGTPAWQALPDHDPRKLLSVLLRGAQAALADDTRQAALAEASQGISRMESWRALGTRMHRGRGPRYIPRTRETT